jgi:predicted ferric reductase
MLFGITISSTLLIAGGATLLALLVLQILLGTRTIKLKGPVHWKVHRWVAYLMVLFALFHATAALAFVGII